MNLYPLKTNLRGFLGLTYRISRTDSNARRRFAAGLWLLVGVALLSALVLQLSIPFLSPNAVEEKLYALQAAENFHKHGVGATAGLSNYSTREGAKPFVYTHLIDTPALIIYAVQEAGGGAREIKLFFTAVNALAIFMFYLLFRNFTPPLFAALLATCLALSTALFHLHDHLHWPFTLLVHALAALLALRQLRSPATGLSLLGAANVLLAALFSWFAAFDLAVFAVLCAVLNKGRRKTAELALFCCAALFAAVALKLAWNTAYLGIAVALQEIFVTVMNRAVGNPGYEDLYAFFNSHGIVLWGAPKRSLGFFAVYYLSLAFDVLKILLPGALAALAAATLRRSRARAIVRNGAAEVTVLLAMTLALLGWDLFFPGHSAGYVNPLFYPWARWIGFLALLYLLYNNLFSVPSVYPPENATRALWHMAELAFTLLVLLVLCAATLLFALRVANFTALMAQPYGGPPKEVIDKVHGKSVYTNLSVIHLGYFARDATLAGRCIPDAVLQRKPELCYNTFESLGDETVRKRLSNPELFVLANTQLSGNAPWREAAQIEEYRRILDRNYARIGGYRDNYHPGEWLVYDLRSSTRSR